MPPGGRAHRRRGLLLAVQFLGMLLLLIAVLLGFVRLGPLIILFGWAAFMWLSSFQEWQLEPREADDDSLQIASTETGLSVEVPAFEGKVTAEVERELLERVPAALRDTMERALAEIQPFCSEQFPHHYAGFGVFPRPGKQPGVTVFRRPSMLFDLKVRERFADLGDALTFADARWSAKHLEELAQRVIAERHYWADLGVHIHKVIPSPSGEELAIVTPDASSARGRLATLYGPALAVYDKPEDVPPPAPLEDPVEPDPPLSSAGR
jgi:hypothetical protein